MGRRQLGFSLLELAVVVVVLSSLCGILLLRLNYYQEAVERTRFEMQLQIYKTGLQVRIIRQPVAITGGRVEGIAGIKLIPVTAYQWG